MLPSHRILFSHLQYQARVSSWGAGCKADQKAVGFLCKTCATVAPLGTLCQAGSQLAKIVGDFLPPSNLSTFQYDRN